MSLVARELRTVHVAASRHHAKLGSALTSLIQASYHARADEQMLGLLQGKQMPQAPGSSLFDEYQDQTGTAMGIVAQIKELGQTFSDDKQEAIEAEHDLQAAFDSVLKKKTEIINSLQSQYNQQKSVLTQVSQEIGESETAEQTAQGQLQNEQAYLGSIETQERDTTAMYQARQKDRADEKTAVQTAVQVLMEKAPALLQLRSTAAAMTASGSTLGPVVAQLEGLLTRLDEQGVQEKEHKNWCESEQTETNAKKTHHDGLVTELTQQIADTKEVIAEKVQGLADTKSAIDDLDASFKEVTGIREKAKADYEAEHADYVAAITALNQAIDILADFYREQQEFVQRSAHSTKQVPDSRQGEPRALREEGRGGLRERQVDVREQPCGAGGRREPPHGRAPDREGLPVELRVGPQVQRGRVRGRGVLPGAARWELRHAARALRGPRGHARAGAQGHFRRRGHPPRCLNVAPSRPVSQPV